MTPRFFPLIERRTYLETADMLIDLVVPWTIPAPRAEIVLV
jgi:hypothetical protein